MDKEFIIKQIYSLVEAHKLWDEMANHIFALGGELWESKYAEAYNFHEALVYDLIMKHRGFPSLDEYEFDLFQETIFDLACGNKTKVYDENNTIVALLYSVEDLYNWMVQVQNIFIPKEESLN